MTEPRFHQTPEPIDLERLLALTGASLAGDAGRPLAITGVSTLGWAGPGDLAVARADHDAREIAASRAGACLVSADHAGLTRSRTVTLVSADPERAFAKVAVALFPQSARPQPLFGAGIAAGAVVHPDARLEPDVSVDPGAVIGPNAEIGRGALIGANAVIGAGVRIGRDSVVLPGASIAHALIGDRVAIGANVALGGASVAPSLGRVVIQDDVEIGDGAVIERGALGDTVIGERSRIGALAHVAADVMIGRHCVAFAQASFGRDAVLADFSIVTPEPAAGAAAVGSHAYQTATPGSQSRRAPKDHDA